MLRRLEIVSEDVCQLLGKVRIVGDLESPAQMRLESVLLPDAANRGGAQIGRPCHPPATPVRRCRRLLACRPAHHDRHEHAPVRLKTGRGAADYA